MASDVSKAVATLEELYGHHTAHLSPMEQIQVALWLARRCTATAEEIAREHIEQL